MSQENEDKKEKVHLDEILKSLFSTSQQVLTNFINVMFNENHTNEDIKISFSNSEFSLENSGYNIIRGDLFLGLVTQEQNEINYQVEFQTKNDTSMAIRMFEYGFNKAKEIATLEKNRRVLYYPKQMVIFIEENSNIEDELKITVVFPNGNEVDYSVPVMKYWNYTDKDLMEKNLYLLLPLQIFKFRKNLDNTKRKNKDNIQDELNEILEEAKNMACKVIEDYRALVNDRELLDPTDLHKMLLAIQNLIEYLNSNYGIDDKIEREVIQMTKSLYDPLVEEKGEKKGKIELTLELLKEKFNPSTDIINEITNKLMSVTDLNVLGSLFKEALKCVDLDSFIKKIK